MLIISLHAHAKTPQIPCTMDLRDGGYALVHGVNCKLQAASCELNEKKSKAAKHPKEVSS